MLIVTNISKSFDSGKTNALKNISFSLEKGKNFVVIGESGSGKTTLIRLLCGLETQTTGSIKVNNQIVNSDTVFIAPENRKIGLVFQDYALFPHLSVFENVVYGIANDFDKINRVKEVLTLVGLNAFENRYPHELSGGQQQRVALARALAPKPILLILDEPFSNLDASLRTQLRNELFSIIKKTNTTSIFVTHDTEDALAVADEILVLHKGLLVQKDTSINLYNNPVNKYVASLFGNIISFDKQILNEFGFFNDSIIHIREEALLFNSSTDFKFTATVVENKFMGKYYIIEINVLEKVYFISSSKAEEVGTCFIGFNSSDII
jgi:iron(III) transport system ATP-binding protein